MSSFKSLFMLDLPCVICSLICLFFQLGSIVLQFTLNNSSVLTSGIPTSAGPCPGTTKNLHGFCFSLCVILTLKTISWTIHDLS